MTHPIEAVANEFLDLAKQHGISDMSPMKLQKILYFAQGWYLATEKKPLFDEQIEAWRYGPVIRTVYELAKEYGNSPINRPLKGLTDHYFHNLETKGPYKEPRLNKNDQKTIKPFLDWILENYGEYSAVELSNQTHAEGTPWKTVIDKYKEGLPRGTDISEASIREYFEAELAKLLNEDRAVTN